MICISSCPDEIADIWIRRIIKVIMLQLNYFSGGRGRHSFYSCQEWWIVRSRRVCVCACVCAHIILV